MRCFFILPLLFSSLSIFSAAIQVKSSLKWPPASSSEYANDSSDVAEFSLYNYKDPVSSFKNRYILTQGEEEYSIRPELVSKQLRSVDPARLAKVLQSRRAYIRVGQCDDGEFTLELMPRCTGAGPGGIFAGGVLGQIVGQGGALIAGYAILYGTKGVIRITAGKEAADVFDQTMVQQSIPHLKRVAENIGNAMGAAGAIAGGASPLP